MRFQYFLKVAGANGQGRNVIEDFLRLSYTKRLNDIGLLTFDVPTDHDSLGDYEIDGIIKVRRGQKHPSVNQAYYDEFVGLYRGMQKIADNQGRRHVKIYAQDGYSLLARAIVAWQAGLGGLSVWSNRAIDEIMALIIQYNFQIPAANRILPRMTANGGVSSRVVLSSFTTTSTLIDYVAPYKNVLAALQELAAMNGDVFHLEHFTGTPQWLAKVNAIGVDRTGSVVFDLDYNNIVNANLDLRRLSEPTKAVVAGQGEGVARATTVQTSPNYSEYNHTELFVDARDLAATSALQARGDAKLAEHEYRPQFVFNPAQAPAYRYGKHYRLGDTITARFEGESFSQKIVGVTVAVNGQGTENIEIELDDA